jgi:hypothetical protein
MTRWLLSRPVASPRRASVRPTLSALEDRTNPAPFVVKNTNDAGTDSLRAALIGVNASADATNTVTFLDGLTGTIPLSSDLPVVTKSVDIQGPGALAINVTGANNFKVFRFNDGLAGAIDVSVSGLTISNGKNDVDGGGGIFSENENVTVRDAVIRNNTAGAANGGGIRANGGLFTLVNTAVRSNSAADGGGVRNAGATFVVTGSAIDSNFATNPSGTGGYFQSAGALQDMTNSTVSGNTGGLGGGLYVTGGPSTIVNSLISGNVASNSTGSDGGGLAVAGGAVVLRNVTVSGNLANNNGGGVLVTAGSLEVRNSTIAFNVADNDNSGAGGGGGYFLSGGTAKFFSTILAKNQNRSDGAATQSDGNGALDGTSANNLIGVGTNVTGVTNGTQGNLVGSTTTPRDPLLLPLAFNGGATKTHAIQPLSDAKDAGDDTGLGLTSDGRGTGFARVVGPKADIGAFEIQAAPLALVVTSAADRNNATLNPADLTLREAIRFAGTDAPTITFAPALNGQTITLTLGRLDIGRSLSIQGPGAAQLTVSGGDRFQHFAVTDNNATTALTVGISGLTLANGHAQFATGGDEDGGAIVTDENTTLDGLVITNNQADDDGGGVDMQFGTLTIRNTTISNNRALGAAGIGGGVSQTNGMGTLVIHNSTVSGNTAGQHGGGVGMDVAASVVITNSTISGNMAKVNGGGVWIGAGTLSVRNSTVAFNKAESDGAGAGKGGGISIDGGTATMVGTIVGKNEVGATGANLDINGKVVATFSLVQSTTGWDQSGSSNNKLGMDPMLGTLAKNGGPTQTHALLAGSPAIDPGFTDAQINPDALTTDQRGLGRKTGASIDIGAVEFTVNTAPTISDVPNQPATAVGAPVGPIAFTVGDAETAVTALTVTPATSNAALVPVSSITFGGTGASRTVTVSPVAGMTGTATITLTVTDGDGATASDTFTVTVNGTSPPVTPPVTPPTPGTAVLIGSPQFAVGSGPGGSSVTLYNPDRSVRFTGSPLGDSPGGVRVASADFTGDGVADLVVGTGPGRATRVLVLDGVTQAVLFDISPFEASFTGGVYVAAGDLNGDGRADLVITPDEGGGPRARVFSGAGFGQLADFFGIEDTNFRGGARPAIADITGDGKADLVIAAGFGGGPRVAVFSGALLAAQGGQGGQGAALWNAWKPFGDFLVFEPALRNGAFVGAGDINGDGFADLVAGGGPGGGPRVTAFSGSELLANRQTVLANYFAGDVNSRGGVRVAVKNLDGDNQGDIVTGAGVGAGSQVTTYAGKTVGQANPPANAFDGLPGSNGVFVG